MNKKVIMLCESAVMIALAAVLELVSKSIIPEMTFGGQITIVSMLPVVLVAWKYGVGKGIITGFVYSLVQMAMGASTISKMILPSSDEYLGSLLNIALMFAFDYILAYTVLGLSAMYRKVIKKDYVSLALGAFTVLLLRYICHITSGYILFGAWAEWFFTQEGFPAWGAQLTEALSPTALGILYSVVYNGMFMIPEMIFTAIAAFVIARPQIVTKVS